MFKELRNVSQDSKVDANLLADRQALTTPALPGYINRLQNGLTQPKSHNQYSS
jgi:hypothetical protein